MARAADTNVIVRLIVRDDPKQLAQAMEYASGGLWVSQVVLVEVAWVLASVYELEARQVATAIDLLLQHADVTIEGPDVAGAALARFRTHKGIDFGDCMILEIARKAGKAPVVTFDRALAKLDGAELIR